MESMNLKVNGVDHTIEGSPQTPLLFVLRNELGLIGAKLGCGAEQCGACAVLVDGKSRLSCMAPVSDFAGKSITTVEGLASGGALRPVQSAFMTEAAAQCGYCTPGLLIAVTGLFNAKPQPTKGEIAEALSGHLCRCGSQPRVLAAIRALQETDSDDDA